jgi:hypothetical protein
VDVRSRLPLAALVVAATVLHAAGTDGAAFVVLLAAVVAAAAGVLEAVAELVEDRCGSSAVALAAFSLAVVVAAASTRSPALALGCLALVGLQVAGPALARIPLVLRQRLSPGPE